MNNRTFLKNIPDADAVFEWYRNAAAQKDPDAIYGLALCYETGKGTEPSLAKAVELYREAAELGCAGAMFRLGELYKEELGGEESADELSLAWVEKAATMGYPPAVSLCAEMCRQGNGVETIMDLDVEWRSKGEDYDSPVTQNALGELSEATDPQRAASYYQKAANRKYPPALYNLSRLYRDGLGVPRSNTLAAEYCQMAATLGLPEAQNAFGIMLQEGTGVKSSDELAFEWFKKAAEQGYAEAMYHLGRLYYKGRGTEQSDSMAYLFFDKAAANGYPEAFFDLGYFYEFGIGVEQSYDKAAEYYRKGADLNEESCIFRLGLFYRYGHGVEQSFEEAARLLRLVMNSIPEAACEMGLLYEEGLGVTQCYEDAANIYHCLVGSYHYPRAKYLLARFFEVGLGYVKKDLKKAYELYQDAAISGYEPAAAEALRLRKILRG